MDKIKFSFTSSKEAITLGGSDYKIADYDGLEAADYQLDTENNINGIGEHLIKKKMIAREIMVEFDYLGKEAKAEVRQRLIRFFQTRRPGTLKIYYMGEERQVDYEVSSFEIKSKNIYEKLSCLLYVKCMDPAFSSVENLGETISTLLGGWKWKFTLPFTLKQYGPLRKNIYNDGHMETPVEIFFQGPAVNPSVTNHASGEYIRIRKELTSDETLYINTAFGKKAVEIINGENRKDAWEYLDVGSDFFMLQPGDNMIEYSSSSGRSKGVQIFYRKRYMGI